MTTIISTITADVNSGGWELSGNVLNDADSISYNQQIQAWYNLYTLSGWDGPLPAFLGHIKPEAWTRNVQLSDAPFRAYTAQEFMKDGDIQGIFFKSVASAPANSHQIIDMTFADILYHVITEHCNLVTPNYDDGILTLNIDFNNSKEIDTYEIKNGNFWSKLKEIADSEFYFLYVNKSNTLVYQMHPMFTLPLYDIVFDLTSDILLEPLKFEKRNVENMGQLIVFGITPDGAQITGTYPTDPEPGPIIRRSGYVVNTAFQLGNITERLYLYETREYTVTARIGNGIGLKLELMDRVSITYTSAVDGINFVDQPFYISKIVVNIDDNFNATTELTLEMENLAPE